MRRNRECNRPPNGCEKPPADPTGLRGRPGDNSGQLAGLLGGCRPYGHCRLLTGAVRAIFGSGGVSFFLSYTGTPPAGRKALPELP